MRRAVAATRQAISPRLAIRILLNMRCLCLGWFVVTSGKPIGFALLQKRLHAFLALGAGTNAGNAFDGAGNQGSIDVLVGDILQQRFATTYGVGAGADQGFG